MRLPLAAASRAAAVVAVAGVVAVLPWLSGRDAAYTVLRARYADREATPEALAAVRAELGLDRGPLGIAVDWLSGVLRGDLGTSWISGRPVAPGTAEAVGVSLTLTLAALAVALVVAALLVVPALRAALAGRPRAGTGVTATVLVALPEFLLATLLLLVGAVWLGWFPPYGWAGPGHLPLPALALGLPAGGLLGRLLATAVTAAATEPWVRTWLLSGHGAPATGAALLRRALPSVAGQVGLVVVGLTGGAVAVEEVFAVPGLGRLTLGAASSQDLPVLQAGLLALLVLAAALGGAVAVLRRALLGGAAAPALPPALPPAAGRRRDRTLALGAALLLATVVVAGLLRDPYASAHPRLAPPSVSLPFGADASGRDLLARVGHGAVSTVGTALLVVAVCTLVGLLLGCLPRLAAGPVEVGNAVPPVVVGLVVGALLGASVPAAALAVGLVSWAPLAAHASALLEEARRAPYVEVLPLLGVGRARLLLVHLLPVVAGPVVRHAALRVPGVALALAALGFLGLGARPPSPEWGLLLAEGSSYVERAPWTVLAPAGALVLVAVAAVSATSLAPRRPHASRAAPARRRPGVGVGGPG
ncbi:ABC transporter permease subunit [Nocardioides sp. CFH 31398]|uniref:ABC transporter permease subunit n=1 Tax=Nocardioides sp. CFH 31398 TaxID=2919579 RepID=UPI001F06BF5B|nr:ABC transporter permease subunit [Nocardioides sp. CFH 31398]MCH1866249.1 ABC transporter permease subunit [Nocardioides sp. CFH 31398]